MIVLSEFFETLNLNKACNAYPFTIKVGIFYRAKYQNILFFIKVVKLLKVQRR